MPDLLRENGLKITAKIGFEPIYLIYSVSFIFGKLYLVFTKDSIFYTVRQPNLHKFVNKQAQSVVRLHGRVICHINGNFVSFQNL